jgi:hypothetical protein
MSRNEVAWDLVGGRTKRVRGHHGFYEERERSLLDLSETERLLLIYHGREQERQRNHLLTCRLWRWQVEIRRYAI